MLLGGWHRLRTESENDTKGIEFVLLTENHFVLEELAYKQNY
jgi:hypothetical protein